MPLADNSMVTRGPGLQVKALNRLSPQSILLGGACLFWISSCVNLAVGELKLELQNLTPQKNIVITINLQRSSSTSSLSFHRMDLRQNTLNIKDVVPGVFDFSVEVHDGEQLLQQSRVSHVRVDANQISLVTVALPAINRCVHNECVQGQTQCEANHLRRCQEDQNGCLVWGLPSTCPEDSPICLQGKCQAVCTNACPAQGERRCFGGGFQICGQGASKDCLQWGEINPCEHGCTDGKCCVPDCEKRSCGPDPVCNASCGLCQAQLSYCGPTGQCITPAWSERTVGENASFVDIWGSDANNVWAVSTWRIWHFDGTQWHLDYEPTASSQFLSVWGLGKNDVWAGTDNGTIYHYDGTSWAEVSSPSKGAGAYVYALWGADAQDLWCAVGNGGYLYHYTGLTWSADAWKAQSPIVDLWGTAEDDIYAAVNAGNIFRYNGQNWSMVVDGSLVNSPLLSLWGSSASDIWSVGAKGIVLHYVNSQWRKVSSGTKLTLFGVWGQGADTVWIVGEKGLILLYDGKIWKKENTPTSNDLRGVWVASPSEAWAVGSKGTVLYFH